MQNLNFCVEALNISGQRNTQEKKMCCSIKDKFFPVCMISSYQSFMKKLFDN